MSDAAREHSLTEPDAAGQPEDHAPVRDSASFAPDRPISGAPGAQHETGSESAPPGMPEEGLRGPAEAGMDAVEPMADPHAPHGMAATAEMSDPAWQDPAPPADDASPSPHPARDEMPAGAEMPQTPGAPAAMPDEDWVRPDPGSAAAAPPEPQAVSPAEVRARPLPRINIQAFCEDQNTASILQQASQDRRLSKTHVSVQMGGLDAASHYYRNAPTPNLIIIESLHERDAMLMDLDRLASVCDAGTKVIVIGHVNDVLLYRELLQRGVSEYLVMPLSVAQLMASLSSLYTDPGTEPLGNVISFVGAKGGAGASTVCHNTAWAISQGIKSDVVIADLDLPFGTAGLDFNQDPVQGIADALYSPERLDEVLLDRLLSRCSDYLSLFAAPGTLDRSYDLSAGACDAVVDVLRKNVPYIAVDVPHLWTEWTQRLLVQSDRVVIVALPDLANLRNAKNLVDKLTAARPNDLPPLLVINQAGMPKRPEIPVKDFASAVEIEPLLVIDFDSQLFGTATNNGQMIEEVSAKAKAAEQFRELARAVTDQSVAKAEPESFLAPLLGKFRRSKPDRKQQSKKKS